LRAIYENRFDVKEKGKEEGTNAIRRANERGERKRGERLEWDEGRRAIKNKRKEKG
jgi:hypothetical protein